MEASIIFHFAGRGVATQRLALIDFAQLLDPRWRPPHHEFVEQTPHKESFIQSFLHSSYNFVQGGEYMKFLKLGVSCWCLVKQIL